LKCSTRLDIRHHVVCSLYFLQDHQGYYSLLSADAFLVLLQIVKLTLRNVVSNRRHPLVQAL
jgi:hypothetical protein